MVIAGVLLVDILVYSILFNSILKKAKFEIGLFCRDTEYIDTSKREGWIQTLLVI